MKIFYSFLIILTAAFLLMLPVTSAVYDFKTDLREDSFSVTTAAASTNATVILVKALYDEDISTTSILSDNATDVPIANSYAVASRALLITGLADNTTRTLAVSYDVYALEGLTAIDTLISKVYLLWLLCIIAFPIAALLSLFIGGRR